MGSLPLWKTALLVLLLGGATVTAIFQPKLCDVPQPSKDYPEPPNRPNVPNTFEVHVDCKITNKNMSTEIHEYYDFNNNRGLLQQVQDGEPFYLYYDYNTNEMLSIFPNERICYADALSTDQNSFLFGYRGSAGKGYIFPPSGALHFEFDDETSAYLGPGVVRGIRVRNWYACQYVDQMDATVNVYWSFSDPNNWDTAVGYPEIPVRCHVNGVATEVRHNYTHNFTHTYDFLHFQNFISTPDVFETPDEIVCPGRKNTKSLPSLPDAFSFTIEAVSTVNHQVTFLREWYDYQMQLVRLEYSPGPSQMLTYGPRPLTEIHDFSSGVAYIMDRELGNCSITPIERSQLGDVMLSSDLTTVHLRTAQQFFYLDNVQPVYLGQKTVRGIPCDAWVASGSASNASNTWEWCFRAANWTSVEDARAQTGNPSGTPVQMKLLMKDAQYDFNFYHFVRADPDVLRYDVSSCFKSTRRRKFDFAVSGQFAATVQKNLRQFRVSVQNAIIKVTGLSPLRIVEIQVVYLRDVHIRVTLLDKPKITGDVAQVRAQPELDAAADALASAVRANSLIIQDKGHGGQIGSMTVLPTSLVEYWAVNQPPSSAAPTQPGTMAPTSSKDNGGHRYSPGTSTQPSATAPGTMAPTSSQDNGSDRYSPETMGGVGFGTLSFGLIMGTVTAFIYLRKTGRLLVPAST